VPTSIRSGFARLVLHPSERQRMSRFQPCHETPHARVFSLEPVIGDQVLEDALRGESEVQLLLDDFLPLLAEAAGL
jgi:hypothetical protein